MKYKTLKTVDEDRLLKELTKNSELLRTLHRYTTELGYDIQRLIASMRCNTSEFDLDGTSTASFEPGSDDEFYNIMLILKKLRKMVPTEEDLDPGLHPSRSGILKTLKNLRREARSIKNGQQFVTSKIEGMKSLISAFSDESKNDIPFDI